MNQGYCKEEGFTLVELIVVIAVLAILASAAVPAYSGYVSRAWEVRINGELEALEHAAQAAALLQGRPVLKITVTGEGQARAYCAGAYAADGVTVSFYTPMDLNSFHSGRIENLAHHPDFAAGCTWSAGSGYWEEGVESLPLTQP